MIETNLCSLNDNISTNTFKTRNGTGYNANRRTSGAKTRDKEFNNMFGSGPTNPQQRQFGSSSLL